MPRIGIRVGANTIKLFFSSSNLVVFAVGKLLKLSLIIVVKVEAGSLNKILCLAACGIEGPSLNPRLQSAKL
jgi:hypothetical protein